MANPIAILHPRHPITILGRADGRWEAFYGGINLGGIFKTRRRAELEASLSWGNRPFKYIVEA